MTLSLLLATVIFIPAIALVGISSTGSRMFGENSQLLATANTTVWSSYSSFGNVVIVPMAIGIGILVLAIVYSLRKSTLPTTTLPFVEK